MKGKYSCPTEMAMNLTLKVAILQAGLTQADISQRTGIHDTKLSKIVRGYREPSEAEQKAIAKVLRRAVHDLFPQVAA